MTKTQFSTLKYPLLYIYLLNILKSPGDNNNHRKCRSVALKQQNSTKLVEFQAKFRPLKYPSCSSPVDDRGIEKAIAPKELRRYNEPKIQMHNLIRSSKPSFVQTTTTTNKKPLQRRKFNRKTEPRKRKKNTEK